MAFSSEVETGSREENASKEKFGASVLIRSEPERLQPAEERFLAASGVPSMIDVFRSRSLPYGRIDPARPRG
jgi:hypothetical protein